MSQTSVVTVSHATLRPEIPTAETPEKSVFFFSFFFPPLTRKILTRGKQYVLTDLGRILNYCNLNEIPGLIN